MDLARTMYDAPTALSATLTSATAPDPVDDSGAPSPIGGSFGGKRRRRPPSPVQSALDKRNAQLWKEKMLQDLDAATAGLLSESEEDCDLHLSSSRKILAIIHQLTTEAAESEQMCSGTRQAVNSELEFFLFGGHGEDAIDHDGPDIDGASHSRMGSSSAAMRAKTRGGKPSTSSLRRHKMTRLSRLGSHQSECHHPRPQAAQDITPQVPNNSDQLPRRSPASIRPQRPRPILRARRLRLSLFSTRSPRCRRSRMRH